MTPHEQGSSPAVTDEIEIVSSRIPDQPAEDSADQAAATEDPATEDTPIEDTAIEDTAEVPDLDAVETPAFDATIAEVAAVEETMPMQVIPDATVVDEPAVDEPPVDEPPVDEVVDPGGVEDEAPARVMEYDDAITADSTDNDPTAPSAVDAVGMPPVAPDPVTDAEVEPQGVEIADEVDDPADALAAGDPADASAADEPAADLPEAGAPSADLPDAENPQVADIDSDQAEANTDVEAPTDEFTDSPVEQPAIHDAVEDAPAGASLGATAAVAGGVAVSAKSLKDRFARKPAAAAPAAAAPAPVAPTTAAPKETAASTPARVPRKARLRLLEIDPWSVTKTAFLLSIALGIITIVAVGLIYLVLSLAGVWDSINNAIAPLLGNDSGFRVQDYLSGTRVMGFTALVAVVEALLLTALASLGSYLYNLAASLLGGVEVTLGEDN